MGKWTPGKGQERATWAGKYDDSFRENVFKLAKEGVFGTEIADQVGIAPSTVYRWCGKAGIKVRRARRIKPSEQQAILEFHLANPEVSQAEIAKKFDLAQSSVHYLLNTRGGITTARIQHLYKNWRYPTGLKEHLAELDKRG